MESKNLNLFSQEKFFKRILSTLLDKENQKEIDTEDLQELEKINNKIGKLFQINLISLGGFYLLSNLFLLKKLKKRPFLKHSFDIFLIFSLSFTSSFYLQNFTKSLYQKNLKFLQMKYSILLKNSICNSSNKKEKYSFNEIKKKLNFFEINFSFLLLIRLMI